jgi:hypothetical protein
MVYRKQMRHLIKTTRNYLLICLFLTPVEVIATPQFARTFRVDCAHCHSSPPRLNEQGLRFVAMGYRLEGSHAMPTVPAAVWNTLDAEWRHSANLSKAFPGRVEIISAGPIGARASYFAEWRALSQSLGGDGRLVNRSGRFEDLFLRVPLTPGRSVSLTAGQFRGLAQVDVSLRLSLSEPLVFSSGVPAPRPAARARVTGLRAFSASGRQPAVRLEYQRTSDSSPADGWFAAATLPLSGELTIPFTDAASFEFEARPKGFFAETFWRSGLTSIGGHVFVGDAGRRIGTFVATHDVAPRVALVGGIGAFHASAVTDTRFSVGGEFDVSSRTVAGVRIDHRTGQGRDPILLLYGNGHLPFGPSAFRQALRLQIEQRVQPQNHATLVAFSHIF